jgi:hypothetical protein
MLVCSLHVRRISRNTALTRAYRDFDMSCLLNISPAEVIFWNVAPIHCWKLRWSAPGLFDDYLFKNISWVLTQYRFFLFNWGTISIEFVQWCMQCSRFFLFNWGTISIEFVQWCMQSSVYCKLWTSLYASFQMQDSTIRRRYQCIFWHKSIKLCQQVGKRVSTCIRFQHYIAYLVRYERIWNSIFSREDYPSEPARARNP